MSLQHTHSAKSGSTHEPARDALGESACALAHAHEVCPLCLSRYAVAVECICVACEAPSCPDCASPMPGTDSMLCYACPVPTKH